MVATVGLGADQIPLQAFFAATETHVEVPLARSNHIARGLSVRRPWLPIDLSVQVRCEAFVSVKAEEAHLWWKRLRWEVALCHSGSKRFDLLGRGALFALHLPFAPPLRWVQLSRAQAIEVPIGKLQVLQSGPGNVARPPLRLLGESLMAAHLLQLELPLSTHPRELDLHVLPPGAVEGVPPSCSQPVRRELLAIATGVLLIVVSVGHNVKVLQLLEVLVHGPQKQEVRVHVDTALVIQHTRPHKVRFGRGIGQPEELIRAVRDKPLDVRVVYEHQLHARRMLLPSFDVQLDQLVGPARVFPICPDGVPHGIWHIGADGGHRRRSGSWPLRNRHRGRGRPRARHCCRCQHRRRCLRCRHNRRHAKGTAVELTQEPRPL
mmetsp:Transcript_19347/g.43519  ORF Transcript_19347/g.43519 Transcript_19347/m.43519 type:complete len:378 (+) Transcript_19347:175-1308(+)